MTDRFIIVGSGPSAQGFKPLDNVKIIAVNQSIHFLSRCDYWFTLDCSFSNYRTMKAKREGVTYFCALDDFSKEIPSHVVKLKRVSQEHNSIDFNNPIQRDLKRFKCRLGLDKRKNYISTGNSAYGALNLTLHLGAKKVLLIGVDANSEMKIDNTYCKSDLKHLPLLFDSAVEDIDFISCGKMVGQKFKTLPYEEGLKWLTQ